MKWVLAVYFGYWSGYSISLYPDEDSCYRALESVLQVGKHTAYCRPAKPHEVYDEVK